MIVERAGSGDIDTLTELRLEYLRADHGDLDADIAETIKNSLADYFRLHLGRDLFCYIIRDGELAVSCAFLLIVEKPMSPAFLNGRTGTVLNVYTRPEFRHKGHAKMIMCALVADAERMDLCTLELKSTDSGYALYRSVGFTDDGSNYHFMKWTNP